MQGWFMAFYCAVIQHNTCFPQSISYKQLLSLFLEAFLERRQQCSFLGVSQTLSDLIFFIHHFRSYQGVDPFPCRSVLRNNSPQLLL